MKRHESDDLERPTKVTHEEEVEDEAQEGDDEGDGSHDEDQERKAPETVVVTMSTCMATLQGVLAEVAANKRTTWHNHSNSCHIDSFIMLELAALTADHGV